MTNTQSIDELTQKLIDLIPSDLGVLKRDIENNIRALLHSTFRKLDLVTREEFDVQAELLIRTREKLDSLEKKLAEIENKKTRKPTQSKQ